MLRLAHAILEAEKSHSWPSASSRPRKANGVVLVQIREPENQEHRCMGQEKMNAPTQAKKVNSFFLHLFVLLGLSTDGVLPTCIPCEVDLLYSVYEFTC